MLIPQQKNPLFYRLDSYLNSYVPVGKISGNFYTSNRHPNDRGNKNTQQVIDYKIGDRKTNLLGLEETGSWIGYDPIIISETEKIEEGDMMCRAFDNAIIKDNVNSDNRKGEKFYKILALPEHFSPYHLQLIVDGKLKDGDKILVECEEIANDEIGTEGYRCKDYTAIKTNYQSHITLYPVEEKMYTREEVKDIVMKFCEWKAVNHQPYSHPPELSDRWRVFSESNL